MVGYSWDPRRCWMGYLYDFALVLELDLVCGILAWVDVVHPCCRTRSGVRDLGLGGCCSSAARRRRLQPQAAVLDMDAPLGDDLDSLQQRWCDSNGEILFFWNVHVHMLTATPSAPTFSQVVYMVKASDNQWDIWVFFSYCYDDKNKVKVLDNR